jgi:hypothetical protein
VQVDFDSYINDYTRLGISGTVSVHFEYDLGGAETGATNPTMSLDKISTYQKNDLNWLRAKFKEHQL